MTSTNVMLTSFQFDYQDKYRMYLDVFTDISKPHINLNITD